MIEVSNENAGAGQGRCPGPSTRDIIIADGQSVPATLLETSYSFLGNEDIDYDRYISPEYFRDEIGKLWPRVWQWACREEHIPEVGDYYTYDIGPYSFIIVRTAERIKAFYNACLHRGTQLRRSGSWGTASDFRCPFHGWTWTIDGDLKSIPCRWDFEHVADSAFKLPEVKCESWGGFIFINMDENAPDLRRYMGVLAEHFDGPWDLGRRHVVLHVEKELPTNWKAAQEAFLEAYHVMETHAHLVPFVADANAQYDLYGDHVSRFVHAFGKPSPHLANPPSEQAILDHMGVMPKGTELPPNVTARAAVSQYLRETLSQAWGVDLAGYSDSEMLDSIEYHLFPNMCLFPGIGLPMIYRFRPLGMDISKTLFEILFLKPLPEGAEAPLPPEPIRITAEQSFTEVPGMDRALAEIYDQDTGNLELQNKGFYSSKKRGETLGSYQEVRIRHFNQILDKYMS